ncbi:MAG: SDR family NAD(P)-dependent oxidoreductase [Phycisphaerae bacterium]|nr:SDR family NAD(P)-dependent oxidoreductase [Phycisphaerae bacterium]
MLGQGTTILVTGAGGFIGSHLVELLLRNGAKVRAFVHYNSRSDIGNLRFLPKEALDKIEIVFGDVRDSGSIDQAVTGCEYIFHLAALIGIPYSYLAPRSYVDTNVNGTLNVLEAVRKHRITRMVHTSTSEVYGTAQYEPIDEKHPLQAQSPYSASKISADMLVESYHRSFGLAVTILRPFNTYGPRQSARAVIPAIISQLLSNKEVVRLGSLDPERDLTFVEDTARAFVAAAESDKMVGKTVHVGNGKSISIGKLAEKLVEMLNPKARIVCDEKRVRPVNSEVMKLICDYSKAETEMGWKPAVSLTEGLGRTIEFVRKNMDFYSEEDYSV